MRVTREILYQAFRFLARRRMPQLAAWLLVLISRAVPRPDQPPRQRCPYRALILNMNKAGFLQDIEESFLGADDFDLIQWPHYTLKALSEPILSSSLDNKHYLAHDPAIEATKAAYRDFLIHMWRHLCAIRPVHVVISANFGYYAQREFAAALAEIGTPFITLQRENVRSPRRVQFWHSVYKTRGKSAERKILVYNGIERDLQISSGVIDPNKVIVTGMPRLDRIHRWRREHAGPINGAGRGQVLFFAFSRREKLTSFRRTPGAGVLHNTEEHDEHWQKLSWEGLSEDTHGAIVELARRRPDLRVIVKTKGQSRQLHDTFDILNKIAKELPSNLEVVAGGDPFQLIAKSQVVVGFNTTALLEAIAAGKLVIIPRFKEASESARRELILDLGDAVSYADSAEQLIEKVCSSIDQPAVVPVGLNLHAKQALRYWVGNDDGAAGRRVLDAIYYEIGAARR